jgi:cytochrome c peroxidase
MLKMMFAISTVALFAVPAPALADEALRSQAAKLFGRLEAPPTSVVAGAEQELGRALFWDTRASLDVNTACASCHPASDWARTGGVFRWTRAAISPDAIRKPFSIQ